MSMYDAAVVGTVVLAIVCAADYVRRAWIRETDPVPATWILMMVMISLSFWMYWASPRRSWTANIGVTAAVVNIAMILIGVIAAHIRHDTLRIAFDRVQRWCLALGGAVVGFWAVTDQPLLAYALVQCIALIAYAATVRRLWRAERSTEPLFLWASMLLANLCAIYPVECVETPNGIVWIVLQGTDLGLPEAEWQFGSATGAPTFVADESREAFAAREAA